MGDLSGLPGAVVVPAFYRRRHRIYLIQDNASYHKKQETYEWFRANRRYVEVFQLPPYWPELNATERIWNYTRKHVTHNRFLNDLRIFATRCFAGLTLCDSIRKRSKACFIPFFDIDVELFMRTYIA
jgi:transposase